MAKLVIKLRKTLQEACQPNAKVPPPNYDLVQSKVTLQSMGLTLGDKVVVGGIKVGASMHDKCPGGTEKSRNLNPLKFVPAGLLFSRCQIYCILRPLGWPNSSQGQLYGRVTGRHVYRIYWTPVQRCGEVFSQFSKQPFQLTTEA